MANIARDLRGERQPPAKVVSFLLDECRMVLPGIQALFGFQLMVVFTEGFWDKLSSAERMLHLAAIALIVIAVALVMTPAAYHRQAEQHSVSENFISLASRLLLLSMGPLLLGICLDFYLIANVILVNEGISIALSLVVLFVFTALWFLLPRMAALKQLARGGPARLLSQHQRR